MHYAPHSTPRTSKVMAGRQPSNADRDYACLVEELAHSATALHLPNDGPDPLVETLLRVAGLRPTSAVVMRTRHNGVRFTLVVATTGIWHDQMHRLLSARRAAQKLKVRMLLVPAARLRRPPFRDNCRLVARCAEVPLAATDRTAVLDQIALDPHCTLGDCAQRIGASLDPVGGVLSLVAGGLVDIDLNNPITGFSRVRPV